MKQSSSTKKKKGGLGMSMKAPETDQTTILSEEILYLIFTYLNSVSDLMSLAAVNTQWRRLSCDEKLWKNIAESRNWLYDCDNQPQKNLRDRVVATFYQKVLASEMDNPGVEKEDIERVMKQGESSHLTVKFGQQLLFDDKTPVIKGGTAHGILKYILTNEETNPTELMSEYILLHENFIENLALWKLLIKNFMGRDFCPDTTDDFKYAWKKIKLAITRRKVLEFIDRWINYEPYLFTASGVLQKRITKFLRTKLAKHSVFKTQKSNLKSLLAKFTPIIIYSNQVRQELSKYGYVPTSSEEGNNANNGNNTNNTSSNTNGGSGNNNSGNGSLESSGGAEKLNFRDIKTPVFVRSLAEWEHLNYKQIRVSDVVGLSWKHLSVEKRYKNQVNVIIRHFNKISLYVSATVLDEPLLRNRIQIVEKWIDVAQECLRINNFNTVVEIIGGLSNAPIHRLARTWDGIKKKHYNKFCDIHAFMSRSRSYRNFREVLNKVLSSTEPPPCVPYLGVFLTDLSFMYDGNKRTVEFDGRDDFFGEGTECLYWVRNQMIASTMRDMMKITQADYTWKEDKEDDLQLRAMLPKILTDKQIPTEQAMFNLSLELEPRDGYTARQKFPSGPSW